MEKNSYELTDELAEETGPELLPCVTCGNTSDDPGGCFDCNGEERICYLCGRICQPYAALIEGELRFVCRRGCPQDSPKEQGAQPFSKDDWHKISELVKREVDANMSLLAKVEGML